MLCFQPVSFNKAASSPAGEDSAVLSNAGPVAISEEPIELYDELITAENSNGDELVHFSISQPQQVLLTIT